MSEADGGEQTRALVERVAQVVHDCWRIHMRELGWLPGPVHDAERRTHDALVPFEALSRRDRKGLLEAVVAEEVPRRLARVFEYQRGDDRELLVEEMHEDLRVGWAEVVAAGRDQWIREEGRVVTWTCGEDGELASFDVRWQDGTVTSHVPQGRELRRLEDAL